MNHHQGQFVHQLAIPIRWYDMDAYAHVNTSVYFTYFEQTRISWLLTIAPDHKPDGTGPVVINTACTFLKSVIFPETIVVKLFVGPPGQSSFESFYEIISEKNPEIIYAQGSAKIVWIDFKTGKSTPVPDKLRQFLPENK
jgi:acyl-CoA thioester hydrolase